MLYFPSNCIMRVLEAKSAQLRIMAITIIRIQNATSVASYNYGYDLLCLSFLLNTINYQLKTLIGRAHFHVHQAHVASDRALQLTLTLGKECGRGRCNTQFSGSLLLLTCSFPLRDASWCISLCIASIYVKITNPLPIHMHLSIAPPFHCLILQKIVGIVM